MLIISPLRLLFLTECQAHQGPIHSSQVFLLFSPFKSAAELKSVCKVSQWGGSLQQNIPSFAVTFRHQAPPPEPRGKASETDRERIKKKKKKQRISQERRKSASPHALPSSSLNLGYSTVDLTPKYRACRLFMQCYCNANAHNRGFWRASRPYNAAAGS